MTSGKDKFRQDAVTFSPFKRFAKMMFGATA